MIDVFLTMLFSQSEVHYSINIGYFGGELLSYRFYIYIYICVYKHTGSLVLVYDLLDKVNLDRFTRPFNVRISVHPFVSAGDL